MSIKPTSSLRLADLPRAPVSAERSSESAELGLALLPPAALPLWRTSPLSEGLAAPLIARAGAFVLTENDPKLGQWQNRLFVGNPRAVSGRRATKRLARFSRLVNEQLGETGRAAINAVNTTINRLLKGRREAPGKDKWQTPVQSIERGRGDCEDYVILKYAALRLIGFPPHQLRIAGVKYDGEYHMVLLVEREGRQLVLDNLRRDVAAAEHRRDLTPLYALSESEAFYFADGWNQVATDGFDAAHKWHRILSVLESLGPPP